MGQVAIHYNIYYQNLITKSSYTKIVLIYKHHPSHSKTNHVLYQKAQVHSMIKEITIYMSLQIQTKKYIYIIYIKLTKQPAVTWFASCACLQSQQSVAAVVMVE